MRQRKGWQGFIARGMLSAAILLAAGGSAAAAASGEGGGRTAVVLRDYTVVAGDNCSHIAKRLFGDAHRVDLIHDYNDLGPLPHKLRPGLKLRLPVKATAGPQAPDARLTFVRNQVEAYTPGYHRGQKGETLIEGNRVGTLAASSAEISFVNETQMQLGEHSMVVIFGDGAESTSRHRRAAGAEEATLLKGTLRAHLAELSGPAPETPPRPVLVATPGGARVELPQKGSEVHVDVDGQATTRLSVLRGRSALAAAGRKVAVPAGFGSRADKGKAPSPPRPLPGAPSWTSTPPALLLGRGAPITVVLSYASGSGPPAVTWHRQLARDARFNDLLEDSKVPAEALSWTLRELPDGEIYARVSGIDADRFEGLPSAPTKLRAAVVQQIPGTQTAATTVVFPRGLLCALDGAPLGAAARAAVSPGRDHQVRCALKADAAKGEVAELPIAAVDSGAVLARVRSQPTRWTATAGERDLSFRLMDSTGAPVSIPIQDLELRAAPGVEVAPLSAETPGEYRTHLRWPIAVVELGLAVQLRGVKLAALPLTPDPRESEPPPTLPETLAPPRLQPVPASAPRRVWLEFGAAGSALFNQGAYGFGGVLELGPHLRLPFGALGFALRLGLEQHLQPAPAPLLANVGVAVTYLLGRPTWRVAPYLGLAAAGMLQRTADTSSGLTLQRSDSGLTLGGLVGAQLRLWRGGLFTEVGYRHTVYSSAATDFPAWNTASVLLGYRFSTN